MKTFCVFVVGAGLTILAGCRHAEPSPIVTAFQNAGGGDVGHATPGSISAFLAKREDLRKQLTPLCKQRQAGAPADWATTDEGQGVRGQCKRQLLRKAHTEVRWCGVLR